MSTDTLPLRVLGSTTPVPFSGIGLPSCGIRNEPLIAMRKVPPVEVVETAWDTRRDETVSELEPQAASAVAAARDNRAARRARSRIGVRTAGIVAARAPPTWSFRSVDPEGAELVAIATQKAPSAPYIGTLHGEEPRLHLGPAAVVADHSPAPQHPVARDHDRNRIPGERASRGAMGTRVARLGGHLGVGEEAAVRDAGGLAQHLAREPADEPAIGAQFEPAPATLEVLVELAADAVEAGGRLEHPRRHPRCEIADHLLLGARAQESDPDKPARRRRDQQISERR